MALKVTELEVGKVIGIMRSIRILLKHFDDHVNKHTRAALHVDAATESEGSSGQEHRAELYDIWEHVHDHII